MSRLTGRQLFLILGAVVTIAVVGVGLFGLVRGPGGHGAPAGTALPSVQVLADDEDGQPRVARPTKRLPHTEDPLVYAEAVARSLFDWSTSSGFMPADYSAAALGDSDPSGEETPGLVIDTATYLPTAEQWLDLGAMEVAQTIVIDNAYVPASWSAALQQAHGQIRPGTTAVTIEGTRHRTGSWHGQPATSTLPVSFTVFLACPPAFDRCHLLRLSQLDNPLR